MKVKLFTTGSSWGRPAAQFDRLETEINSRLEAHPDVAIEYAHKLSQPTFGWGQLAVALWYGESDTHTSAG